MIEPAHDQWLAARRIPGQYHEGFRDRLVDEALRGDDRHCSPDLLVGVIERIASHDLVKLQSQRYHYAALALLRNDEHAQERHVLLNAFRESNLAGGESD